MSNPTELPDLDRMSTTDAQVYLVNFMMQHFSDKTYHRYILGQARENHLAGDFAWQMATALRKIEADRRAKPEGEAPQAEQYEVWNYAHECWEPTDQNGYLSSHEKNRRIIPAATLSPLCGAQHAESGKEAIDVLRRAAQYFEDFYANVKVRGCASVYEHVRVLGLDVRAALAAQQAAAPGAAIHYPECWDTAAYPILESALVEVYAHYKCSECESAPGTPEAPMKPAHGHRDDYYLLANGRRLGLEPISRVRNMPNWVLAMELFATGSTSAHQICHDAGIDPDGTTVQRGAQLDGGQEGSESNG